MAEANAITDSGASLSAGTILQKPSVASVKNDANSFKPYNPNEIVGSTTPSLPYVPPAPCNPMMIIVIIVMIIVTIYTAGAAAGAMGATGTATGTATVAGTAGATTATSIAGTTTLAGATTTSALTAAGTVSASGAFSMGSALLSGGALTGSIGAAGIATSAFIGGVAGSIAGQVVGNALGVSQGFSLRQAIAGGITSVLTAGIGAGLGGTTGSLMKNASSVGGWGKVAASALGNAAAGYVGNRIAGVNDTSFSWKAIAAGAVTNVATAAIGNGLNKLGLENSPIWGEGQFAGNFARNAIGGVVSLHVRRAFGFDDRVDYGSIAADAFGNAFASAMVQRASAPRPKAQITRMAEIELTQLSDVNDLITSVESDASGLSTTSFTHKVNKGDTLTGIAGTSDPATIGMLMYVNNLSSSNLRAGKEIIIDDLSNYSADQIEGFQALGEAVLNSDNARVAMISAKASADAEARLLSGSRYSGLSGSQLDLALANSANDRAQIALTAEARSIARANLPRYTGGPDIEFSEVEKAFIRSVAASGGVLDWAIDGAASVLNFSADAAGSALYSLSSAPGWKAGQEYFAPANDRYGARADSTIKAISNWWDSDHKADPVFAMAYGIQEGYSQAAALEAQGDFISAAYMRGKLNMDVGTLAVGAGELTLATASKGASLTRRLGANDYAIGLTDINATGPLGRQRGAIGTSFTKLERAANAAETPRITLTERAANHHVYVDEIAGQLRDQGYTVKGNGARFYDSAGVEYTNADIFAIRPNGGPLVMELKTGGGGNTLRQNQIYPQIISGDALPSRSVARMLGIKPNVPLNLQGFPNGIPVYQVKAPGL